MALRLAGEDFSVVQGLDALGWPREVEANDADLALKITQSGSGPDLQFQQPATISTSTGTLDLDGAGDVVLRRNGSVRLQARAGDIRFLPDGSNSNTLTATALTFQGDYTIGTPAGDLTLNPSGEIDLNGHQC